MPRKQPTQKLGVYGKYDILPQDAVELYFESKQQNKYYIKKPYWDIPREGLELTAIQNEREYNDAAKQQKVLRKKLKIDKALNDKRINELNDIQLALRDRFITVNDFIRDCEDKEIEADRKIVIETQLHEQLENDIEKLTTDVSVLTTFQEELQKTVDEFKIYEDIMEEVVAESDLFKSVKDLMDRCDALMMAQVEISDMEQEKLRTIEVMRQNMVKATNDAALTVMGLNNELAELERCYNVAKTESLRWEKIISSTKDYIGDDTLTINRLMDAIQHLYKLLRKRNVNDAIADDRRDSNQEISRSNPEKMLDYITDEIKILQEVIRLTHIKVEKEKKSIIAEKGSINKKKK